MGSGERALFVSRKSARLSTRAVDLVVRALAREAGLVLSAHALRHTCLTRLVRGGADVVLVAELAGHRRLETRGATWRRRPIARMRWSACASSTDRA